MARYQRLGLARFHQPPFKPCLRFSRTRLNDDLLDVACIMPNRMRDPAFHRDVNPVVRAFADSRTGRTHLAHTDSRTEELSRFYNEVVGRFRHALTLTSPPT